MSSQAQLSQKIKDLISNGRLDEALEQFKNLGKDTHLENEIIQQLARLAVLNRADRAGELEHEDKQVDRNQITFSVLELIEEWQKSREYERQALRAMLPKEIIYPDKPFKGLNFYTRDDALIFYGRSEMIGELIAALESDRLARIILLYGQSGVGKSSLLNAGLLPRIEDTYKVLTFPRHEQTGWDTTIEEWQKNHSSDNGKIPLLIIDQLEEVFTRPIAEKPEEAICLVSFLRDWLTAYPTGKMILGFRKEYLADWLSLLEKEALKSEKKFVKPLSKREIYEVIFGPMEDQESLAKYKFSIEEEVIEQLVLDIGRDKESHIAPALQLLLTQLWEAANEEAEDKGEAKAMISDELYQRVSKPGVLLADYLDEQIKQLQSQHQKEIQSGFIWDLLEFLTTDFNTANKQSENDIQQQFGHVAGLGNLLDSLKDAYLVLSIDSKKAGKSYRLAHDSLAPLVNQRYATSQAPGQLARRILESRVKEHSAFSEYLLSEKDLEILQTGKQGMRSYSPESQNLITRSQEAIQIEKAKQKKNQRKSRSRLGILAGTLVLVLGIFYFVQNNATKKQSLDALALGEAALFDFSGSNPERAKEINAEYASILHAGFHIDSVLNHFSNYAQSYILKENHQGIIPILNLLPIIPNDPIYQSQLNSITAEVSFILLFSDRVEGEEKFLAQSFPKVSDWDIQEDPAQVKLAYDEEFGKGTFDNYLEKYLPKLVTFEAVDTGYEFICPQNQESSLNGDFTVSLSEITLSQLVFLVNCQGNALGLSSENMDRRIKSDQYEKIHYQTSALSAESATVSFPASVSGEMAFAFSDWFGGKMPSKEEYEYMIVNTINIPPGDEYDFDKAGEVFSVEDDIAGKMQLKGLITNIDEWCRNMVDSTNQFAMGALFELNEPTELCEFMGSNPKYSKIDVGFRLRLTPENPWSGILAR